MQLSDFIFRLANESDAPELFALKWELHEESEFLRLSPKERLESIEDERCRLLRNTRSNLVWVGYKDTIMVGYLYARIKIEESMIDGITLGVHKDYRSRGIGNWLMNLLEEWAKNQGLKRIELCVMGHNESALRLYQKIGFEVLHEGTCTLYDTGKVVQEFRMAKQLA